MADGVLLGIGHLGRGSPSRRWAGSRIVAMTAGAAGGQTMRAVERAVHHLDMLVRPASATRGMEGGGARIVSATPRRWRARPGCAACRPWRRASGLPSRPCRGRAGRRAPVRSGPIVGECRRPLARVAQRPDGGVVIERRAGFLGHRQANSPADTISTPKGDNIAADLAGLAAVWVATTRRGRGRSGAPSGWRRLAIASR